MERPDETNELKDSPTLLGMSKDDPFVVPDGFFDRFPHAVQARIVDRERRSGWSTWLQPRVALAALAMVAIVVSFWTLWPTSEGNLSRTAVVIEPEDLPQGTWTTELLYDELGEEAFTATMALPSEDDVLFAYLSNEDLTLEQLTEDL